MALEKSTLDQLKIERPAARRRRSRGPLVVAVVLIAAIGIAVWWWKRPRIPVVQTAIAREVATTGNGARTLLNASGYVTARREATVSSKVTGRVLEVMVEEGMKVSEGQVLARIDATNTEASLHLAQAQLESARKALGETQANLELAQRTLERAKTLREQRVVSDADVDTATAGVSSLEARLARQRADVTVAEREVALWKQQVDDAIIRAPFAGVVTSKNAQPGEMISPISAGGGFTRTGICTIVDMSSLEIEVDVSESYINRVKPDQPVIATLDSYPEWHIPAKVIAIIPTADRQKATVRVRIAFENLDPRILPDMSLKVAFQSTAENDGAATNVASRSVIVPRSAVRRVDDRDVVWIVRDGKLERRAVTIDDTRGEETTLSAGVAAGEKVVVQGPDNLVEGGRVSEK